MVFATRGNYMPVKNPEVTFDDITEYNNKPPREITIDTQASPIASRPLTRGEYKELTAIYNKYFLPDVKKIQAWEAAIEKAPHREKRLLTYALYRWRKRRDATFADGNEEVLAWMFLNPQKKPYTRQAVRDGEKRGHKIGMKLGLPPLE